MKNQGFFTYYLGSIASTACDMQEDKMSIGKNIRKARQEADMTQEQLAELLNISVSAVSQWESDKTTPDISMIPALCNVFQMTSDKLLDIELEKNEEAIEAIRAEANRFASKGKGLEAEKILLEGLRRFPNSYGMMYDLMYITYAESNQEKHEESVRKQYLERAINYAEKIIQESKEDDLRSGAKQIRCYIHADAGEHDEAIAIARTMDSISCCQQSMLTLASKGTERYQRSQEEIFMLIQSLGVQMVCQNVKLDDGNLPYTSEEDACLMKKHIAFLTLMFEDGDFGFFHTQLCRSYRELAYYYAVNKDEENALLNLSLARDSALAFIKLDIEEKHTSLLLRGLDYGDFYNAEDENDADWTLMVMENKHFDFLRENARFLEIQRSLQEYAGGWGKLER